MYHFLLTINRLDLDLDRPTDTHSYTEKVMFNAPYNGWTDISKNSAVSEMAAQCCTTLIRGSKSFKVITFSTIRPYTTSCSWIIITYILSRTVSEISRSIGQIFSVDGVVLHSGWTSKFWIVKFGLKKLKPSYKACFDMFNLSGADHECDRQTDGQTFY